jgi:hypothetical protein
MISAIELQRKASGSPGVESGKTTFIEFVHRESPPRASFFREHTLSVVQFSKEMLVMTFGSQLVAVSGTPEVLRHIADLAKSSTLATVRANTGGVGEILITEAAPAPKD